MNDDEIITDITGKVRAVIKKPKYKWVCQNCGQEYDQDWLICESCGGEDFSIQLQ